MTQGGVAALSSAVGFTADELALNRAGRLSDRQRDTLATVRRSGRTGSVVMAGFLLAFIVVIAVVVLPKLNDHRRGSSQVPIVPIVAAVLGLVVVVFALSALRLRRRLNRLTAGSVLRAEGPAHTRVHRLGGNVPDVGTAPIYGGGVRYELTIGAATFFVAGPAVLEAFSGGAAVYRAYYAAGGGHSVYNRLLSVERIS